MSDENRKSRNARAQRNFRARLREKTRERELELQGAKEEVQRANEENAHLRAVIQSMSTDVSAFGTSQQQEQQHRVQQNQDRKDQNQHTQDQQHPTQQIQTQHGRNQQPPDQRCQSQWENTTDEHMLPSVSPTFWSMPATVSDQSVTVSPQDLLTLPTDPPAASWALARTASDADKTDSVSLADISNDFSISTWPTNDHPEIDMSMMSEDCFAALKHDDIADKAVGYSNLDCRTSLPVLPRETPSQQLNFSAQPCWSRTNECGAAMPMRSPQVRTSVNVPSESDFSRIGLNPMSTLSTGHLVPQSMPTNHLQASILAAHHLLAYIGQQVTMQSGTVN